MSVTSPNDHRSNDGIAFWIGVVVGWSVIVFAIVGIVSDRDGTNPPGLVRWLVGLALAHDLVVAPVVAITGVVLSRLLPDPARGPVASAAALSGLVALFAWPNVGGYGRRALNDSTLPWDYGRNLAFVVSAIWLVTLAVIAARVHRRRRQP